LRFVWVWVRVEGMDEARMIYPKPDASGRLGCVVLDVVEPGVVPPYCVHGKTTCYSCDEWVWLGDRTAEAVLSGSVVGICRACAARFIPPSTRPTGHLDDTRRGDPHG
jgi:hypothetical protein